MGICALTMSETAHYFAGNADGDVFSVPISVAHNDPHPGDIRLKEVTASLPLNSAISRIGLVKNCETLDSTNYRLKFTYQKHLRRKIMSFFACEA